VGLGVPGFEVHGQAVLGDGLIHLALGGQHEAEVAVNRTEVRPQGHGCSNKAHRLFRLAGLYLPLEFLDESGLASDRKLSLLACACCRRPWDWLVDPRSRGVLECVERFAAGTPAATTVISHDLHPCS
jgi:hypothetical protein